MLQHGAGAEPRQHELATGDLHWAQEQKITLKNDGPVAATVNLGQVSAPFAFKNAGGVYSSAVLELAGGQTHEVWVQFNPTASGNFSGSTALSLSGACVRME